MEKTLIWFLIVCIVLLPTASLAEGLDSSKDNEPGVMNLLEEYLVNKGLNKNTPYNSSELIQFLLDQGYNLLIQRFSHRCL